MKPEFWLRGPVHGVDLRLQPVAHALLQAEEDLEGVLSDLTVGQLWQAPGSAATLGFHTRHVAGAIERLLTYARGEQLTDAQRSAIALEKDPGSPPADGPALFEVAQTSIRAALEFIQTIDPEEVLSGREVGRALLPSTMLGILFHIAEHTTRHVGQMITTRKIILEPNG
ncbi:DinB family protein [Bacteroidota bacterium]